MWNNQEAFGQYYADLLQKAMAAKQGFMPVNMHGVVVAVIPVQDHFRDDLIAWCK